MRAAEGPEKFLLPQAGRLPSRTLSISALVFALLCLWLVLPRTLLPGTAHSAKAVATSCLNWRAAKLSRARLLRQALSQEREHCCCCRTSLKTKCRTDCGQVGSTMRSETRSWESSPARKRSVPRCVQKRAPGAQGRRQSAPVCVAGCVHETPSDSNSTAGRKNGIPGHRIKLDVLHNNKRHVDHGCPHAHGKKRFGRN